MTINDVVVQGQQLPAHVYFACLPSSLCLPGSSMDASEDELASHQPPTLSSHLSQLILLGEGCLISVNDSAI